MFGGCLFVAFLIFGITYVKNIYRLGKNEQQAFENMIMNTNDNTVAKYMAALKSYDKLLNKYNVFETRIRISQGFIEISENANVSAELKEQFKTLLTIKGIPV